MDSLAWSTSSNESQVFGGEFGTLIVVIIKAKNLSNKRAVSKQNPFCSARIGTLAHKTKTIDRGGQAPCWDHEVRFKLQNDNENSHLKLCVFDENGKSADIIGDTVVPLKQAFESPSREGFDAWHPIYYNKRYTGEVYLEMTFYPKKRRSSSRRNSSTSVRSLGQEFSPASSMASAKRNLPPLPGRASVIASASTHSLSGSTRSVSPARSPSPSRSLSPSRSSSPFRQSRPLPKVPGQEPLYKQPFHSVPDLHRIIEPTPPPLPVHDAFINRPPSPLRPSLSGNVLAKLEEQISSISLDEPRPTSRQSKAPLGHFDNYSSPALTTFSAPPPKPAPVYQEDITRQINDGYGDSMFERINPMNRP